MTGVIATIPRYQFSNALGVPLIGGKLYTYLAGTTTLATTYQDEDLTTANENPICLDSTGSCTIWLDPAKQYKFVLKSALGITQPGWPVDNISGAANSVSLQPTFNLYAKLTALAAVTGSSLFGFIQDGDGAVAQTAQDVLREIVSVTNFGASPDNTESENVIAFQKALDYANSRGGLEVHVPSQVYNLNGPLKIYQNTRFRGNGWGSSRLVFSHIGYGLTSTWPINTSTAANIEVTGLSFESTNVSNTGAAFMDVGGSYLNIEGNRFSGYWGYGVVLDQSELSAVARNNFTGISTAQLWLVNGPENTLGANPGYTNRITIRDNQFNAGLTTTLIQDDGGANHLYLGNNLNGGEIQMRVSNVDLLTILNHECEACASFNIYFADTTASGRYVGGVESFLVANNQFGLGSSDSGTRAPNNIYIDEAYGGAIENNFFYRATAAAIDYNYGSNYRINGISVSGNNTYSKVSAFAATSTPLVAPDRLQVWKAQGNWNQSATTYCTSAFAIGYQQVTPATMVGIYDGAALRVVNNDGSNPETVIASQVSSTSFFCTFTSSKAAGFRIFLEQGDYSGTYTPQVTGSSPPGGSNPTTSYGSFSKIGNRCIFQANDTWTSLNSGAAGQLYLILPFPSKTDSNSFATIPCLLTGPGAVGAGALFLTPIPGTRNASLVRVDQTTGAFVSVPIPTSGSIYVSGSYEI